MKTKTTFSLVAAALAASCLLPGKADAAISVNIEEQGTDVVISYSGSIDTTGIGFNFIGASNSKRVFPSGGAIQFNDAANWASIEGFGKNPWTVAPTAFGTGDVRNADSFSIAAGNAFGFQSDGFYLNSGYVSGTTISGSMTFENETLASLGINVGNGIMNATFSSGDTLTVNAISAVPEPSAFAAIFGAVAMAFVGCRRKRRA